MIRPSLGKSIALASVLLGPGGCAFAPSPFGGAPVEERSLRPPPPPPPQVEVRPLERPLPIIPREYSTAAPTPVIPPGPFPAQPYEPPAPPTAAAPPPAAVTEPPPAEPPPAQISAQGNPAVVALLDSAAGYVSSNELDKAAAALERALRIEPQNASIWHDLGQIRLHQGDYPQAEAMASKSTSLAGGNHDLKLRNWRLIAVARRAQGDQTGADAADAQVAILERGGQ